MTGMWERYICKQLPLPHLSLPALPLPKKFTEILLGIYTTGALVADWVNRSIFSNTLKALDQTLATVFFKIIICRVVCVDAANLTASIDAVNFLLTLADAPSIFKKLTLGVTP